MSTEVKIPRLGFSMTEGILSEWLVEDGAEVQEGQPLYALEAEKAVQEIEAPASGRLSIRVQAGDEAVAVGTVVAEIV